MIRILNHGVLKFCILLRSSDQFQKSFYTYFSTNINTGIAPIIRAIEDENITADLVYAPKLLGTYGEPSLMRHNKLVYNQELRDKLWFYTANELNLDI